MRKRVIIFASGTKTGGGSGFEKLVEASRSGILDAEIVGVVSQHLYGGVRERAGRLEIPLFYFPTWGYESIIETSHADYYLLSGWTRLVVGLSPAKTINIHPAPLPGFGGKGWFGHTVHEAVLAAYKRGEVGSSAVCMHFATAKYDDGPVFFRQFVKINSDDTANTLAARVNAVEHRFQARVTNLVVNGEISWNGWDPKTLKVPPFYLKNRPPELATNEQLIF